MHHNTINLTDILQILKKAHISYDVSISNEKYSANNPETKHHIEIIETAFGETIIDIWDNKIESINLNASNPEFSKIYYWASLQTLIVDDFSDSNNKYIPFKYTIDVTETFHSFFDNENNHRPLFLVEKPMNENNLKTQLYINELLKENSKQLYRILYVLIEKLNENDLIILFNQGKITNQQLELLKSMKEYLKKGKISN